MEVNTIHRKLTTYLEKYKEYLHLLDKEFKAIRQEDVKKIEVYIDLESSLADEIIKQEKKIIELINDSGNNTKDQRISKLLDSIEQAREKALLKNKKNRELLKRKLKTIKQEMSSIQLFLKSPSPFKKIGEPSLIDILR